MFKNWMPTNSRTDIHQHLLVGVYIRAMSAYKQLGQWYDSVVFQKAFPARNVLNGTTTESW